MAKNYLIQFFSSVNPSLITGFSPTFTVFKTVPGGANATPPGITEIPTATGLYYFTYGPTNTVAFVIDGGASLPVSSRYIAGNLDPVQAVDEQLTGVGNTLQAIGNTLLAQGSSTNTQIVGLIGSLADSYGSTLSDPTTVFGYLKRLQEYNEGNSLFTKSSGVWQVYTRGVTYVLGPTTYPGTTTLLSQKTIADSGSVITKT